MIYAGTTKGKIFLIKNINNKWTKTKINPESKNENLIPSMIINDIATFPENKSVIVIVLGGLSKPEAKISRVWRGEISDNGKAEWIISVDPVLTIFCDLNIPINAIVIDPTDPA